MAEVASSRNIGHRPQMPQSYAQGMQKETPSIFIHAKNIYKEEGILCLLKRSLAYLTGYENRKFYLFECGIKPHDKTNVKIFLPRPKNYCLKIVSSNLQLDQLVTEGFNISFIAGDPRFDISKRGMLAFLAFVEKELAAVGIIAMTEEAKNSFNPQRYEVNFTANEICGGAVFTVPGYQAKNLVTYISYEVCEYFARTESKIMRCIIEVNNVTMQKILKKVYPECRVYSQAHYLRIFGLRFWKEKAVTLDLERRLKPERATIATVG